MARGPEIQAPALSIKNKNGNPRAVDVVLEVVALVVGGIFSRQAPASTKS